MLKKTSIFGMPRAVFIAFVATIPLMFAVLYISLLLGAGRDAFVLCALSSLVFPITLGYKWRSDDWSNTMRGILRIGAWAWPGGQLATGIYRVYSHESSLASQAGIFFVTIGIVYGGIFVGWLVSKIVSERSR